MESLIYKMQRGWWVMESNSDDTVDAEGLKPQVEPLSEIVQIDAALTRLLNEVRALKKEIEAI